MAIILEAAYSKKLGLPSFSSHSYVVSIRAELSDLTQVEAESARLYALLQQSVDHEIQAVGFLPDGTTYDMNSDHPVAETKGSNTGNGTQHPTPASRPSNNRPAGGLWRRSSGSRPSAEAGKPDAVEVMVEADLASHGLLTLVGVLDLVQNQTVIDFKTSSTTPNPDRAALANATQATVYLLLYRDNTGNKEAGIELHHLVKLKQPRLVVVALPPIGERERSRLLRVIESYVEGLARRDFIPSPGLQYVSCEFFHERAAWH